jgi:hypothetical protein
MTIAAQACAAGILAARSVFGVPITYYDGDRNVDLVALRGRSAFEVLTAAGQIDSYESDDFICLAADLVIDGTPVLPIVGAVVQIAAGGGYEKYEVLKLPGKKPYTLDPTRTVLRIHTKLVSGGQWAVGNEE